jgi:hypothetical protein
MFKLTIFFLFVVQLVATPFASAELYMWTDEKGVKHLSDTPPPGQTDYKKGDEIDFDPPVYDKEKAKPKKVKPKEPPPPAPKAEKPKEPEKTAAEASPDEPVIVPPADSSYWQCSHHAGKNFKDLMDCAEENFKLERFDQAYNCSYCAKELKPDNIEAIVLNFKANYYSSHKTEDIARGFLIEIISRQLEEKPDDTLVAFKKWVEDGKEVRAFKTKN